MGKGIVTHPWEAKQRDFATHNKRATKTRSQEEKEAVWTAQSMAAQCSRTTIFNVVSKANPARS